LIHSVSGGVTAEKEDEQDKQQEKDCENGSSTSRSDINEQ